MKKNMAVYVQIFTLQYAKCAFSPALCNNPFPIKTYF